MVRSKGKMLQSIICKISQNFKADLDLQYRNKETNIVYIDFLCLRAFSKRGSI